MTTRHLTHEQLCDVILDSPTMEEAFGSLEAAHDHLRNCLICSAELQDLRASLSLFRNAAHSYAGQVYARPSINRSSIAPSPRYVSHLLYWAAAAAIALVVALPLGLHRQHSPVTSEQPVATTTVSPQATTESDEALLDGIAQDLSTEVPAPMQPLADPTAGAAALQGGSDSNSVQRKN